MTDKEKPHAPDHPRKLEDIEPIEPVGLIPTDHEIGEDNITTTIGKLRIDLHNPVFIISGGLVVLFSYLLVHL